MRYAGLIVLLAAFVLQIWFVAWKNADEPQEPRGVRHPALIDQGGTPLLYTLSPGSRTQAQTSGTDQSGSVIEGAVTTPTGEAAAGVEVQVEKRTSIAAKDALRAYRRGQRWNTRADGEGRFSIAGLPAGQYVVAASTSRAIALVPVVLEERSSEGVTLQLQEGGPLEGQVLTPTGEPVPDASVLPVRQQGQPGDSLFRLYAVQTDTSGHFALPDLPVGTWDFLVVSREHAPTLARDVKHEGKPVQLKLAAGATLGGRLLNAQDGKPVGGIPLQLVEKELGLEQVTVRTNPAGVFQAENIRAAEYVLTLDSPRWALQESAPTASTGATAESFVVALEKTGSVRGRVVSESDPDWGIAGALVHAEPAAGGAHTEVKTDARGGYFFSGLKAGEYRIRVASAGDLAPVAAGEVVQVVSGERIEGPVFRAVAGAELTGEVLDAGGQPVSDAAVYVQSEGLQTFRSDDFGRFSVPGLRHEQELMVWAEKSGMQSLVEGPAGAGALAAKPLRLQLSLPNTGSISGRVVNAQGGGLSGIEIICSPSNGVKLQELRTKSESGGAFSFGQLAPAEYRLHVAGTGPYAEISVPITLQADSRAEGVEVVLP